MDTVTNTFEQRIEKLSVEELVKIASEEFGLSIAENVPAEKIRLELLRQNNERLGKARTMNERSAMSAVCPNDPLLTVVFRPMDFANAPVGPFVFNCGHGKVDKKLSKSQREQQRKRGYIDEDLKWHLFPGQTYQLPSSLVKHLQSLVYMDAEPVYDTATGMISGSRPIKRPRFSLDIQLTDKQIMDIGKTSL